VKTTEFLKNQQSYIEDVLERLNRFGFSSLTRLIRKEWHPMYPIRNLQDTFYNMALDSKYPPLEFLHFEEDASPVNREAISRIGNLLERFDCNDDELGGLFLLKKSFLTAISFLFTSPLWNDILYNELKRIFTSLYEIQVHHLRQMKDKNLHLQAFLASEDINDKDLREHGEYKIFHLFEYSRENKYYSLFYKSICQVQARLIDLHKDTEFLVFVLKEVIATCKEELPLLPYIRPLLERVIEKKTLSHEQGRKQCAKGFKEASYMEEFQEILAGVIGTCPDCR